MKNKDPELLPKLWRLHERGLSYASDTPAVNLLLADMAEGVKLAAEAIAAWNTRTALLPCQVTDAALDALERLALLAGGDVNMDDPLRKWFTVANFQDAREALDAHMTASTIPTDGELTTAADGLDLVSAALQEVHALSREGVADGTYDAHMMGQIAAVERGASLLRRAALSTIPRLRGQE